jgi:uncharacterized cupredoxin-like copper-binding protein
MASTDRTSSKRRRDDHGPPTRSRRRARPVATPPSEPGRDSERLERAETRSQFALFAAIVAALGVLVAVVIGFSIQMAEDDAPEPAAPATAPAAAADAGPDISAAAGEGIDFEPYRRPDPTLPAVPPGAVKRFKVDVFEHVTKVSNDLAPTRVWSFGVNGKLHRGTGVSTPMVVNEGDDVEIKLVNGGSKEMAVTLPHSIDFHSSEVDPGRRFKTVQPGETHVFRFKAKHPGVFMFHCATAPVLMHTGAGMVGAMIVKPKNLAPADRELWLTQQEFYLGQPGKDASIDKMNAKKPDVIAFNGYANQYKEEPIQVKRGERVRMYVLNAGPSIWSAFHVIGTVFDRTVVEGNVGHDAQTVNLAPSQGGWVEFTLDEEGSFPFVTHAFGDMVKGALGVLTTANAPKSAEGGHDHGAAPPAKPAAAGSVDVEAGEMYVKPGTTEIKAGKVSFNIRNAGAMPHALAVELGTAKNGGDGSGALAKTEDIAPGATATLEADLKPGSYELYCHVPGHYGAGQKVTLTVR